MGARPGAKPHLWKAGPDPRRHKQYKAWAQQLNQARYRGEHWDLPFDEWTRIWDPYWDTHRGRQSHCLCLVRKDYDGSWSTSNVELITRQKHSVTQARKLERQRGKHWRLQKNLGRFGRLEELFSD